MRDSQGYFKQGSSLSSSSFYLDPSVVLGRYSTSLGLGSLSSPGGRKRIPESSEIKVEEEVTNLCLMTDNNFDHSDQEEGCPALLFEVFVIVQLAAPYALTLVGKFILRCPNLDVIRKFFVNLNLSGSFHIGLLDQHLVAI
ncbi:hypothetical protein IEQ34_006974 [Dendrobium chrysotoxum]|uniref:Uncharacterized protein n=1 Tax=Dendrobium chrysotoxum TaxID=161865 RepID=A0AAV7H8A4_DENCH|nr:hypothetical protein IEQ34_006974 [Dendrobium chrysotoxum]